MRSTPPPPFDVPSLFPELAGSERTTVRLHPRRGEDPGRDATKMGGRFGWPSTVPWPRCDRPHDAFDGSANFTDREIPPDNRPFVPVLQLRRDDVPELGFPPDTDIFQLLWCPASHPGFYAPAIEVFWRSSAELADVIAPVPIPAADGLLYVPGICVVHPERVVEYPGLGELNGPLMDRIGAWEDSQGDPLYQWSLSSAPGTKVGGYADWLQDPERQTCQAGHPMDHLLTISDTEFDGGTWHRWLPIEEAGLWSGPTRARLDVQEPAGLQFGMGSIYVFICRRCETWPIAQIYQR